MVFGRFLIPRGFGRGLFFLKSCFTQKNSVASGIRHRHNTCHKVAHIRYLETWIIDLRSSRRMMSLICLWTLFCAKILSEGVCCCLIQNVVNFSPTCPNIIDVYYRCKRFLFAICPTVRKLFNKSSSITLGNIHRDSARQISAYWLITFPLRHSTILTSLDLLNDTVKQRIIKILVPDRLVRNLIQIFLIRGCPKLDFYNCEHPFLWISDHHNPSHQWYDMTWHDMIWHDMIWYDMIWYDTIWYDTIRHDMISHDMIWYGMIFP